VPHLILRADIEIRTVVPQTISVVDSLAGTDAEKDIVGARVIRHQVVRVVRSDERHACSLRQLDEVLANALLRLETVLLDLEEVVAFSENLFKLDRSLRGLITLLLGQIGGGHA